MGLEKIEHFVVLMLENRSFDHVFGLRHGVDGLLDEHGQIPFFKNRLMRSCAFYGPVCVVLISGFTAV